MIQTDDTNLEEINMKQLIICEKPTLARSVANALEMSDKSKGYYENDQYIVTNAFGHLFALQDVDDYFGKKQKWSEVELPFIPPRFKFVLKNDDAIRAQFGLIKQLAMRMDVGSFIHCGDADREGEVIVRLIVANTGVNKPMYRLWLPDQTEDTIRRQLNDMKDDNEYNNLFNEGLVRTYLDWLYGINFTRYLSIRVGNNTMYPAGRVLIPIVKYIYDRDKAIADFKQKKYYVASQTIERNGTSVNIELSKEFEVPNCVEAMNYLQLVNSSPIYVNEVKNKQIEKRAKKLFSLTTLQQELSTLYKYSFSDSLSTIQTLYEKGYLTYPRTNTEYLTENEKDKVKALVVKLSNSFSVVFKDTKHIFDSSKVESHSAIMITDKFPNMELLSDMEKAVYTTVRNRVLANFCIEPCIAVQSEVVFKVGEEIIKRKGEAIVQKGWMEFEHEKNDKLIPNFVRGEIIISQFAFKEKMTAAPKKITENSLASYLKNPFRNENATEDDEYKAILSGLEIGTEATRTGIIENAIKYKYISKTSDTFSITEKGKKFIRLLESLHINLFAEKTVQISKSLKEVYKGIIRPSLIVSTTGNELKMIINTANTIKINPEEYQDVFEQKDNSLGECPKCGNKMIKGKYGYFCQNKDFQINYDNKFLQICKIEINDTLVKRLLKNGYTTITRTSRKGTEYKSKLIMMVDDNSKYPTFDIENQFQKTKNKN